MHSPPNSPLKPRTSLINKLIHVSNLSIDKMHPQEGNLIQLARGVDFLEPHDAEILPLCETQDSFRTQIRGAEGAEPRLEKVGECRLGEGGPGTVLGAGIEDLPHANRGRLGAIVERGHAAIGTDVCVVGRKGGQVAQIADTLVLPVNQRRDQIKRGCFLHCCLVQHSGLAFRLGSRKLVRLLLREQKGERVERREGGKGAAFLQIYSLLEPPVVRVLARRNISALLHPRGEF
ncbi:hypothetical protein K470DRAFT_73808 [Piedraia hortae CBS 480.64]|uniref:Uncharacterized protein n=1 Tax=Piedraia hortae CBS 480.64 TaxID=1314780 RepID=A0A6A7BZA5_9PEZI|nr:hypothetical protein K470DRAFT_73808 [Piedraia hortae CBS 480.64]